VFERVKETDEELRKIRVNEMVIQERLQQMRTQKKEVEQMRWTLESLRNENAKLKRVLQERELQAEQTKSEADDLDNDTENDRKETDEEQKLEEQQRLLFEKKKAIFESTKVNDEELWKIRDEEMDVLERLQQIRTDKRETEHMRRAIERYKMENSKLRELEGKLTKSLDEMRAHAAESDSKVERLEAELSSMKEKVGEYEQGHGAMSAIKELTRQTHIEQKALQRKIIYKDMQRTKSYSKTQEKEKEALKQVASLRDEIVALRRISEETQQRELLQSSFTYVKQRHQQHKRTGNELIV